MPATSREPSGRFASTKRISNRRLWSTKEGVGETSGQTVGSSFSTGFALAKIGSAEEKVFFIGADPKVRSFTGAIRRLGFGPDVFADALVPSRRAVARRSLSPKNPKTLVSPNRGFRRVRCGDGYRFAKRQGKSISANPH